MSGGSTLSADERRRLRRYERAVDRMMPMQRAIFLGHVVEDLTYREIADKHDISIIEVECHMWRALAQVDDYPTEKNHSWWQFWRR